MMSKASIWTDLGRATISRLAEGGKTIFQAELFNDFFHGNIRFGIVFVACDICEVVGFLERFETYILLVSIPLVFEVLPDALFPGRGGSS